MSTYLHDQTRDCGLPLRVLTAWTSTNPARRFVVRPNRSKPMKKKCEVWDWYDLEIKSDWYRMNLYEMYNTLNPQQRRQVGQETSRQMRIEGLEVELVEKNLQLQKSLASLTFWKSIFFAFAICMSLVLVAIK
nr:DNA-(apurinic or apyrimidinic site) lyase 2 [Tanacetum cinerariifolium]